MSKKDILKRVNLSSLVEVLILQGAPGEISVFFEPIDVTKNVVVDEDALASLNEILENKIIGLSVSNPNAYGYIKEFCAKWLDEMSRAGLAELCSAKDEID